jgi:hypothetical protein
MKKQIQTSLIRMIISLLLIGSPGLANNHDPHHSYFFNIHVNDPTYGKLNGNFALTMDVLDDNNNIIWTSQENALFMQGISEFSFTDDSFIKNGASSLRVTIPEIDHTDTLSLTAVPYATHAKHAKNVHFNNVEDMPSSILFFKDNVASISDSNTKELTIRNQSKNNNTASSLTLKSDKGDNFVSISSLKNNQGQQKTHISSKDDIEFYRDGKLVLKLGEDNFQMNGYSSLTATDIANMGFLHSETQVDEFVNNNGYLKSADMNAYITADQLVFSGSNYQTSSAYGIGVYDQFDFSDSIRLQDVLKDFDSAIGDIEFTLSETDVDAMVANNGYALSSDSRFSDARTPLITSQSNGDLIYYKDGWKRLAKGNDDQILSIESGYPVWKNKVILSDSDIAEMGYIKTDTNTQLTESQVDSYVANNGYALASDSRFSDARTPLITSQSNGDLIYYKDGWKRLARGNDDQVLSLSSGYPVWKNEIIDTNTQLNDSDIANMGYIKYNSPINASNITSGTIPDARLSSNVSKLGSSITDGEISGSISGSKISAGVNGSSITTGTISDDRLPNKIENKENIESDTISVETLTVKTIIYDNSGSDENAGSSLFGEFKTYNINHTHTAPTDGFITIYCNVHSHKHARMSIYAGTIESNVDSFSDSTLIARQDLNDSGGTQIYNATLSIPIPKGYYFHLKPSGDYKSCKTTWVGIGG